MSWLRYIVLLGAVWVMVVCCLGANQAVGLWIGWIEKWGNALTDTVVTICSGLPWLCWTSFAKTLFDHSSWDDWLAMPTD